MGYLVGNFKFKVILKVMKFRMIFVVLIIFVCDKGLIRLLCFYDKGKRILLRRVFLDVDIIWGGMLFWKWWINVVDLFIEEWLNFLFNVGEENLIGFLFVIIVFGFLLSFIFFCWRDVG